MLYHIIILKYDLYIVTQSKDFVNKSEIFYLFNKFINKGESKINTKIITAVFGRFIKKSMDLNRSFFIINKYYI